MTGDRAILSGELMEQRTCPQCHEAIWDVAFASKLNKCWNCGLAFDTPEEEE